MAEVLIDRLLVGSIDGDIFRVVLGILVGAVSLSNSEASEGDDETDAELVSFTESPLVNDPSGD